MKNNTGLAILKIKTDKRIAECLTYNRCLVHITLLLLSCLTVFCISNFKIVYFSGLSIPTPISYEADKILKLFDP